jgi:hypothetical protein
MKKYVLNSNNIIIFHSFACGHDSSFKSNIDIIKCRKNRFRYSKRKELRIIIFSSKDRVYSIPENLAR